MHIYGGYSGQGILQIPIFDYEVPQGQTADFAEKTSFQFRELLQKKFRIK